MHLSLRLLFGLSLASLALGLAGCGGTAAVDALPGKVVVALKPDKDPDAMLAEQRALEDHLAKVLGIPVEVIVPLSGAVIEEGLANGTIDLAYVSGGTLLQVAERGAAELLLAGEIRGKTSYESLWLALRDAPVDGVESLRGKPVAFASRTSTSGYLIPHWDLVKRGLLPPRANPEAFFGAGNAWYGSGYVSAVERVLSGEAVAAAVSDYVFEQDKHLTVEQRARLKVVARQGPVPTHAIAVRTALSPTVRDRLRQALETLNEPASHALRDRVFTSRLVRVDTAAHVAPLREAFAATVAP